MEKPSDSPISLIATGPPDVSPTDETSTTFTLVASNDPPSPSFRISASSKEDLNADPVGKDRSTSSLSMQASTGSINVSLTTMRPSDDEDPEEDDQEDPDRKNTPTTSRGHHTTDQEWEGFLDPYLQKLAQENEPLTLKDIFEIFETINQQIAKYAADPIEHKEESNDKYTPEQFEKFDQDAAKIWKGSQLTEDKEDPNSKECKLKALNGTETKINIKKTQTTTTVSLEGQDPATILAIAKKAIRTKEFHNKNPVLIIYPSDNEMGVVELYSKAIAMNMTVKLSNYPGSSNNPKPAWDPQRFSAWEKRITANIKEYALNQDLKPKEKYEDRSKSKQVLFSSGAPNNAANATPKPSPKTDPHNPNPTIILPNK